MPPERFIDRVETKLGRVYRAVKDSIRDRRRGFTDEKFIDIHRRAYGSLTPEEIRLFRQAETFRALLMAGQPLTPNSYDRALRMGTDLSEETIEEAIKSSARDQLRRWGH